MCVIIKNKVFFNGIPFRFSQFGELWKKLPYK